MRNLSRRLGGAVLIGVLVYLILITALHFVRSDYDPARNFLSEYAVGRFGVLGTATFCVLALITLALAVGLFISVRRSWALGLSCLLLLAVSCAFCVSALYPTDLSPVPGTPRPPATSNGQIHDLSGAVVFLGFVGASLLLPVAYRREGSRVMTSRALLCALLILGLFTAFFLLPWAWRGAGERLVVAAVLIWMVVNARYLQASRFGANEPCRLTRA